MEDFANDDVVVKISSDIVEQIVSSVIENHAADGSATISSNGESLLGQPSFAIAVFPHRSTKIKARFLHEEFVRQFVMDSCHLITTPNVAIGTWYSDEEGVTYLDVCVVENDLDRAVMVGERFNQIAIFDLSGGHEIAIGGDGSSPEDLRGLSERDVLNEIERLLR